MAMAKAKKALSLALAALFAAGTLFSFAPNVNAAAKTTKKVVVNYEKNCVDSLNAIRRELNLKKDLSVAANRVAINKLFANYKASLAKITNKTKKTAYQGSFDKMFAEYLAAVKASSNVVVKPVEATVVSVANPADITVNVGAAVTLPTTVEATMSDNTKKQVSVVWDKTVDSKVAGDVTVTGKAGDKAVSVKVSVKEIVVKAESVKAIAANKIEVKFNTEVDTTKIKLTVKRDQTNVTTSNSFSTDKKSVVLSTSTNFPTGDYTVNVKNGENDLGTSNIKIEQEKVAKITITSDQLSVDATGKMGWFTYKVFNQYDEDITNKNIASINWTVPGATNPKDLNSDNKGVITCEVKTGDTFNFLNLQTATVTGVDNSANLVVTQNLKVVAATGTLSDMKLTKVQDNASLKAGDTSKKYYIEFEAKDMSGNPTNDFYLIKNGLTGTAEDDSKDAPMPLTTSGYINAKLVNKSGKGVIELKVTTPDQLTTNIPVTVTAITKNGKSSTLNLTLNKKDQVVDFRLQYPVEDIAYGDTKEIPFVAYDQNGNQVTSWDDLVNPDVTGGGKVVGSKYGNVNLSPAYNGTEGFYWVQKGNNDAKLMYKARSSSATTDTTAVLTASTNTGKFSSITLNIRAVAQASTLAVDEESMITKLVDGAGVEIEPGFFTAKDKYGRAINLSHKNDLNTYVEAQLVGEASKAFEFKAYNTDIVANGATKVRINKDDSAFLYAKTGLKDDVLRSGSVKFTLVENGTAISSKTVDFIVIKASDVKGLKIDGLKKLYNTNDLAVVNGKKANNRYVKSFNIYGVDENGKYVALPATALSINKSNSDLTTCEVVSNAGVGLDAPGDLNNVKFAVDKELPSGVKETSTTVTVSAYINNSVKAASFTVTSSNESAVATTISAPDEIDLANYQLDDVLKDAISVKDQYGENMLRRLDNSVTVHIDGVQYTLGAVAGGIDQIHKIIDPNNAKLVDLKPIVRKIEVTANNGMKVGVTFKDGLTVAPAPVDDAVKVPAAKDPVVVLPAGVTAPTVTAVDSTHYTVDLTKTEDTAVFGNVKMTVEPDATPSTVTVSTTSPGGVITKNATFTYNAIAKTLEINLASLVPAGTTLQDMRALAGNDQTITVNMTNSLGTTSYTINLLLK